jgi:hypothetical protein
LHDRLPNSRVGDPEWSVRLEWRRWRVIARLPDEPDRLGPLRERFLASRVSRLSDEWRWLRTEALPPRPDVRGP